MPEREETWHCTSCKFKLVRRGAQINNPQPACPDHGPMTKEIPAVEGQLGLFEDKRKR